MEVVKKLRYHAARFNDALPDAEIQAQREMDICLQHRGVWNDLNFKGISLPSGSKHPNVLFPRTTESWGDVIVDRHALTNGEKGGEGAETHAPGIPTRVGPEGDLAFLPSCLRCDRPRTRTPMHVRPPR